MGIIYILIMIIVMANFDSDKDFPKVAFELMSAFGTVGLSMGITPYLSIGSKIILMFTMFLGRVGPLYNHIWHYQEIDVKEIINIQKKNIQNRLMRKFFLVNWIWGEFWKI